MIDFNNACNKAFITLSRTESVTVLNDTQKKSLNFPVIHEVWEVRTEVPNELQKSKSITFYLCLSLDFPLTHPSVYLSPEDYNNIRYIPHVNADRKVCTYDSETTRPDPNRPGKLVVETLRKAKNIVEDGIFKRNIEDFEKEFIAYWDCKYEKKDEVLYTILSLIDGEAKIDEIFLICFEKQIRGFKYILHQNDKIALRFKKFINDYKIKFNEVQALYIGNLNIESKPPFNLTNREVIKLISDLGTDAITKFKSFINEPNYPKFIIFRKEIDDVPVFLGWFHRPLKLKRNGFRPGKLSPFKVLSSFQSGDYVMRTIPEVYTYNRLESRSSGDKMKKVELKFVVAGIGSLGSNLIFFLNSLNNPEFRLIDLDILKIENTRRHLLGFDYVGMKKTEALMDFLKKQTPIQEVTTREQSIITLCKNEPNYFNEVDYIFITIGKTNIDNWVGDAVMNKIIIKPVFFIWVEPYLAGGHCIYLHPKGKSYKDFFDDDNHFRYNIINKQEYLSNNVSLSLREAGCQTTYVPYASNNVISFLSKLFPIITTIIKDKTDYSTSFTWVGEQSTIENLGIRKSELVNSWEKGEISENKL